MLENEVFNRPYVRDITKTCECTCSVTCNPDIITNADRIRAMSDKELAEALAYVVSKLIFEILGPFDGGEKVLVDRLREAYLNMLQQPAEED